jgi:acetolactate synthase-1/2/3 large subunit
MVRQWQQLFHDRNYSETYISQPDFVMLATAYNIPARKVVSKDEVDDAMLINFVVGEEANVYPMIPSGGSFSDLIEEGD